MIEKFSFELSDRLKKIAPEYANVVYNAELSSEIEGVYAVSGGAVEGVEHYKVNDVLTQVANGHWVIVE